MIRATVRAWLMRRRREKAARAILSGAFESPEALRGTSLEPRHRSRWVLLHYEVRGEDIVLIRFGILRHPRPYAFSRQAHKVIERYELDVLARRITRIGGFNITREAGRDSDD